MIMPVGQMILADTAGPARMGRVMSITGVPTMLAPILGPTIGGLILESISWRWIFYVNVPIGAIALFLALRVLPVAAASRERPPRLDVTGLLLMATGMPALTYGLSEIGITGGFTSDRVVIPLIAGVVLLALFVLHALRVPNPLLDLRLFRRRTYAAASVVMFFLGGALFGALILLPLYYQQLRHVSVIDTGLLLGPQGLGMAAVMPFVGRLTDRIGGGPLVIGGVVTTVIAGIPLGLVGAHTSFVWLSAVTVVRGVGIGFAFMPAFVAAFVALERHELPDAAPQLNVMMRVGGSIGTAVLAVVLSRALLSAAHTPAGIGRRIRLGLLVVRGPLGRRADPRVPPAARGAGGEAKARRRGGHPGRAGAHRGRGVSAAWSAARGGAATRCSPARAARAAGGASRCR